MFGLEIKFPWWFLPVALFLAPIQLPLVAMGLDDRLHQLENKRRRAGLKPLRWPLAVETMAATAFWCGLLWLMVR